MSEDTTTPTPDELPPLPEPEPSAPTVTFGGQPAPGVPGEPLLALAPQLDLESDDKPVLGLGGDPINTPTGIWYAAVDDRGQLLTDADGRVVRVRPPVQEPRTPLTQLVDGSLAT